MGPLYSTKEFYCFPWRSSDDGIVWPLETALERAIRLGLAVGLVVGLAVGSVAGSAVGTIGAAIGKECIAKRYTTKTKRLYLG